MTKYHMHKVEGEIADLEAIETILQQGKYATLALCRQQEPYIVTLNYGYDGETRTLFFHSAPEGLKLEFLRANPTACGTVIVDEGYVHGKCTHAYRSVVFWGRVEFLQDSDEKRRGLERMIDHLEEDAATVRGRLLSNPARLEGVEVLKLRITEITGKGGQ
jgi:uncharacterized protein